MYFKATQNKENCQLRMRNECSILETVQQPVKRFVWTAVDLPKTYTAHAHVNVKSTYLDFTVYHFCLTTTTTTNFIKNWKITNYITFPPANSLWTNRGGGSWKHITKQDLCIDGLNNNEDTTIQYNFTPSSSQTKNLLKKLNLLI